MDTPLKFNFNQIKPNSNRWKVQPQIEKLNRFIVPHILGKIVFFRKTAHQIDSILLFY